MAHSLSPDQLFLMLGFPPQKKTLLSQPALFGGGGEISSEMCLFVNECRKGKIQKNQLTLDYQAQRRRNESFFINRILTRM